MRCNKSFIKGKPWTKAYLWEKLGGHIQQGLQDDDVLEIILNPDNKLWFHKKGEGFVFIADMKETDARLFVNALSHYEQCFLNHESPILDAVLPFQGERINITIPPVTSSVSFNIRKRAKVVFHFEDYIEAKILSLEYAEILRQAIRDRRNILVSGSPGSGKTTFTNALLAELTKHVSLGHRVVMIEQVPELQCSLLNTKAMLTTATINTNTLLWVSMRASPDSIIVGEVRDASALDMLKAWNTGTGSGFSTIHANSAKAAVQRVLDLCCEAVVEPPYALAAEALDIIVHIEARNDLAQKRCVTEIVEVIGFDSINKQFHFRDFSNESQ